MQKQENFWAADHLGSSSSAEPAFSADHTSPEEADHFHDATHGNSSRHGLRRKFLRFAAVLLAGLALGYWLGSRRLAAPINPARPGEQSMGSVSGTIAPQAGNDQLGPNGPKIPLWWTCSMHPQIKLPQKGQCPICFMDLIPLAETEGGTLGPRQLRLSPEAVALADIQTTPAVRKPVERLLRLVGRVTLDETRLAEITARVNGRLDRMFVDYTGATVRADQPMVLIYSPELVLAQQELLLAWKNVEKSTTAAERELSLATLRRTEEKLRLLGILPEQIEEIKRRGTVVDHLTIHAPIGGVVIERQALEGTYVQRGTKIYTIADLSQVWVLLEAYEPDLPWLRLGQVVELASESLPGERFAGWVSFIDPVLNEATRTIAVRITVPNEDLRLKPGMFVTGLVRCPLDAEGRPRKESAVVISSSSQQGPQANEPIANMSAFVPAAIAGSPSGEKGGQGSTSYSQDLNARSESAPLVIPASAPLLTGKRAVVYVKLPNQEEPTFEGREVLLGPRAGDFYVVLDGLKEGELVVTNGNFKIDSALQIQAKPSMMSSVASSLASTNHSEQSIPKYPPTFRQKLRPLYEAYLQLQQGLGDDRLSEAQTAWEKLRAAVGTVTDEDLLPSAGEIWRDHAATLTQDLVRPVSAEEPEAFREAFEPVAQTILRLVEVCGHPFSEPLFEAFCPMAFNDRGARWLQRGEEIDNPYFGHAMRTCGFIEREFPPQSGESDNQESAQ